MRAVFEVMGVTDVVAKTIGSTNQSTWCVPPSCRDCVR